MQSPVCMPFCLYQPTQKVDDDLKHLLEQSPRSYPLFEVYDLAIGESPKLSGDMATKNMLIFSKQASFYNEQIVVGATVIIDS